MDNKELKPEGPARPKKKRKRLPDKLVQAHNARMLKSALNVSRQASEIVSVLVEFIVKTTTDENLKNSARECEIAMELCVETLKLASRY